MDSVFDPESPMPPSVSRMPAGSAKTATRGMNINIPLGATHAPLTKLVTTALRERILSGSIALGERLIEGRLSEELGVSRMPVREALRELAAEGIVTIEPRRGAYVTTFSEEQKRDVDLGKLFG
jgi:hypothetical protein